MPTIFTKGENRLKHLRTGDESVCVTLGASHPPGNQKENVMMSRRRLAHTTATVALALVGTVLVPSVASAATPHHAKPAGTSWTHVAPNGTSWTHNKPGGTSWTHTKPSGTSWTGTSWTMVAPSGTSWTGTSWT